MTTQEARNHHFVPKFLLRPWCIDDLLHGYWWNPHRDKLDCKIRGLNSFCFQLDLLTLHAHHLGRDAIETVFFGEIDTKGATARDHLLASGPSGLSNDQRCDFARLLLSLEARRPINVKKIREQQRFLADSLDSDPEILEAMANEGLVETPSEYYEQETGTFFEDIALVTIQNLVENPKVGIKLINAHWHVVRLGNFDGSLILSDRPLIEVHGHGFDHPRATWILPLNPKAAFVACNNTDVLRTLQRLTPRRFAKLTNVHSASQAERFIFCADRSHKDWIGKYLRFQYVE